MLSSNRTAISWGGRIGTLLVLATCVHCCAHKSAANELSDRREEQRFPIAGCGVGSVAAVLRQCQKQFALRDVDQRFRELDPSFDPNATSANEIIVVLKSFGIDSYSARSSLTGLRSCSHPSILYFPPRNGQSVGHFCVMVTAEDEHVTLFDIERGPDEFRVSYQRLGEWWDGELIIVGSPPSHIYKCIEVSMFVVCTVVLLAASRHVWRCRFR